MTERVGSRIHPDPHNRRYGRRRGVAITFGAIAVALGILFGDYIAAEWNARDAEREVIDLATKIPDNATREAVAEAFAWGHYDYLRLRARHEGQWDFHTPYRFGGSDWILVVTFDGGRAVSVRVGTSDDINRRPESAPPDRPPR